MKTLLWFFIMTLTLANLALAREGAGSSGGGDPLVILAQKFDDEQLLQEAIDFSLKKMNESPLPESHKKEFAEELDFLKENNKFLVLPAIILLGNSDGPEDYELPDDVEKFLSLGAMTKFSRGSIVYLADRVQKYSVEKLADVISHEVLHHIMPVGLTDDEHFMEKITAMIMESKTDKDLLKAVEIGGYFRKDFIPRTAFLKASGLEKELISLIKRGWKNHDSPFFRPYEEKLLLEIKQVIPKNLAQLSMPDFQNTLIKITHRNTISRSNYDLDRMYIWGQTLNVMNKFASKINPDYVPARNSVQFGCKRYRHSYFSPKCYEDFLMNEVFSFAEAL